MLKYKITLDTYTIYKLYLYYKIITNNLNLNIMYTIAELIKFTDESLNNWYLNAKANYNIDGKGKCFYDEEENEIVIYYVENGEKKVWSMAFYDEYRKEQKIKWVFDCWMELC